MAISVVIVAGTGIKIPAEPDPIVGFVAARRVYAPNEAAAAESAKAMILKEWNLDKYRQANIGDNPTLEIEEVRRLNFFRRFSSAAPTAGYTFYSGDGARGGEGIARNL
jgi:hypothetical protein